MILHDWMSWPDSEITWRVPSYPADDDTSDDAELARRLFVYVMRHGFWCEEATEPECLPGFNCRRADVLHDNSGPNSYVNYWADGKIELIVRNDFAFGFEEKVFRSMTSRLEVLDWLRRVMLLEDLADV